MARILSIDLPMNKRVEVALVSIYGIGYSRSREILRKANVDFNAKLKDLDVDVINNLRTIIEKDYSLEGELRAEKRMAIKRLMDINSFRGVRHRRGLPVRGQRTKTNAKTAKRRVRR